MSAKAEGLGTRQFATFFVDGLYFGIDVLKVQEVMRYQPMTPVPLAPRVVEGLINLRGQIVVAIDLRLRLGLRERAAEKRPMNVVIKTDEGATSFLVDEIGDVVDVSDADFEAPPDTLNASQREFLEGVYKMKGRILHVLATELAMTITGEAEAAAPRARAAAVTDAAGTIFARIGGRPAVEAAVEEFYKRVLADPALKSFFTFSDMDHLKAQQKDFFTTALGGPKVYKGRDMRTAHAHLKVKKADFGKVAGHLQETLLHLGVPAPLVGEVIGAVAGLESDIVAQGA